MNFTVNRPEWYRGNGPDSSLLTSTGSMCCLGFLGRACGISKDELLSRGAPADVSHPEDRAKWPRGLIHQAPTGTEDSMLCVEIIRVNDNVELAELDRETQLTELFAKIGLTVVFTDG